MIGEKIRQIRLHFKLNQVEFAKIMESTNSFVCLLEKKGASVSSDKLQLIVDRLGVDARFLFGQVNSIEESQSINTLLEEIKEQAREIERLRGNKKYPELDDIMELISNQSHTKPHEIKALLFGYFAGKQSI